MPARVLRFLAGLLWPMRCAACQRLVPEEVELCEGCLPSLTPVGTACPGCALPWDGDSGTRCPGCRRRPLSFARAAAPFLYGGALADAIVRLKHGDRPDLAHRLGRLLAPAFARAVGDSDVVVPVPLHAAKLARRGYNQALLLARAARRYSRVAIALEARALVRVADVGELGRKGPAARRRAVAAAFRVARPQLIAGRRVLLVDDVMTTGATASACATALAASGAREIGVLTLARTEP